MISTQDMLSGLAGGALIGLSAVLLMAANGRISGISGIFAGVLSRPTADRAGEWLWRVCFIAGLVAGGALMAPVVPSHFHLDRPLHAGTLIVAGLLVGIGTRLGGGCTSGHGVCGLARLSPRGLAAVITFLLAGMITVYVARHVLGGAS